MSIRLRERSDHTGRDEVAYVKGRKLDAQALGHWKASRRRRVMYISKHARANSVTGLGVQSVCWSTSVNKRTNTHYVRWRSDALWSSHILSMTGGNIWEHRFMTVQKWNASRQQYSVSGAAENHKEAAWWSSKPSATFVWTTRTQGLLDEPPRPDDVPAAE